MDIGEESRSVTGPRKLQVQHEKGISVPPVFYMFIHFCCVTPTLCMPCKSAFLSGNECTWASSGPQVRKLLARVHEKLVPPHSTYPPFLPPSLEVRCVTPHQPCLYLR